MRSRSSQQEDSRGNRKGRPYEHHAGQPSIKDSHRADLHGPGRCGTAGLRQPDRPDPLRGLANDAAALADFVETVAGPVVLAGHSYGGMVITNAAAGYLKAGPGLSCPGFAQCFANGLPASQAAMLAVTQRPIAFSAGSDPSGVPAWQTIPSWSLIGTADHVIPPAEQLFMSKRAHARVTEIDAGHLSLISRPGAVTRVIVAAAQAAG